MRSLSINNIESLMEFHDIFRDNSSLTIADLHIELGGKSTLFERIISLGNIRFISENKIINISFNLSLDFIEIKTAFTDVNLSGIELSICGKGQPQQICYSDKDNVLDGESLGYKIKNFKVDSISIDNRDNSLYNNQRYY